MNAPMLLWEERGLFCQAGKCSGEEESIMLRCEASTTSCHVDVHLPVVLFDYHLALWDYTISSPRIFSCDQGGLYYA